MTSATRVEASSSRVRLGDQFRLADGIWKVITTGAAVDLQCQNKTGEMRNAIIRYPHSVVVGWERA